MCTSPQTDGVNTWPCSKCDACVSYDRFDWTARCMAEKYMHKQTMAVTLTYSDDTEYSRQGAAMFRYSDVRLFLANLRWQAKDKYGKTGAIRFAVGGEQGERHGRVHWHIIIFSDVDLLTLGAFTGPNGQVSSPDDIVSLKGQRRRRHWSMWPHGFVVVQEPDMWGINYAISYALKERFQAYNSKGQRRYNKSETFGTSMFRMSKLPPPRLSIHRYALA